MNGMGDGLSGSEVAPVEQPETRATLLGAEMLNWSDLEPADARPAVGGPVALELLDAVLGEASTVLVAGPHALEVIERIAGRAASTDVLVRSFSDGETIAERLEGKQARVFAGGLDRFGPEHGRSSYDVVVALDGVERLVGPDTAGLTWAVAVQRLRERVAPGGRLLLGTANSFGLDRLLDVPRPPRADEWGRDVGEQAPATLDAVTDVLAGTGLATAATYSVFPDVTEPVLGFGGPASGYDAALVARATARRHAAGPKLADPYRTAYDAVAAGLGSALAPGHWFVLGDGTPLPERLGMTDARTGELVEERLVAALRADDHQALRQTVIGYVDWLQAQDHATAAAATTDNVLTDGTSYSLLDTGTEAPGGTHGQLAVRHLARFVNRAMAAGTRLPWTAGGTPRALTERLAAIARLEIDDSVWETADTAVTPQGHAEQLATIERLSAELAEARKQVDWFEGQLDKLRKSRSYRVGRTIVNPLRTTYSKLRTRLR